MKKLVKINCNVRTFLYQPGTEKLKQLIKLGDSEKLKDKYLLTDEGYLSEKRIELNPVIDIFYINIPEEGLYITNTATKNPVSIGNYYGDLLGEIGYITDTGIRKKILTFEIEDENDIDWNEVKILKSSDKCDFHSLFFPSEIISYKDKFIPTVDIDTVEMGSWFDNVKSYVVDKDLNLLWS